MKKRKTLLLDAVRNIINRKIAFLSIITIMTLGVGGLLCIYNLGVSIKSHANHFYREYRFKDLEMVASLGILPEDVEELKEMEGVLDAEGAYRLGCNLEANAKRIDASAISETERINIATLTSGKMPQKENECALNRMTMEILNVQIGDTVKLSGLSVPDLVKGDSFVITGEVIQPEYITKNEYMILLPDSAFDPDALKGRYTVCFVRADISKDAQPLSASYKKELNALRVRLEEFSKENGVARTAEIKKEAGEKLEEARTEADEGLSEAKEQLEDGKKELDKAVADALKELEENEKLIADGSKTLEKETADAERKLDEAEEELRRQLADALRQIEEGEETANRELATGKAILDNAEGEYKSKRAEYEEGKRQYEEGVKAFADAKAQLDDAEKQISDGEKQIHDALRENADKVEEYIDLIELLFDDTYAGLDEIEEKYPELKNSASWSEFKALIADKESIMDTLRNGSDEEIIECLYNLEERIETIMDNLPSKEQVREEIGNLILKATIGVSQKYEELKTLVQNIKKLVSARIQYEIGLAKYEEELAKADLPSAEAKLKDGEAQLNGARKQLDNGWATYYQKKAEAEEKLADARAQYEKGKAEGEQTIADARAQLNRLKREKQKEIEDGKKKISEGREELQKTKDEKEKELEEGWETFREKETEVKEQLEEAEDTLQNLDAYNYVVNPRSLTASFLQLDTTVKTIYMFSFCFIPIFLLVASLVCFSTIAIIVDEQKKQLGAVKALGFYNGEAGFKFILFSLLGTVTGNFLGFGLGYVLYKAVKEPIVSSYIFGEMPDKIAWLYFAGFFVGTSVLASVVALAACNGLLKCSAIGLINGSEPVLRTMKGKKNNKNKNGSKRKDTSLYSRLIVNNLKMDRERVLVSVVVIVGSCALIGFGYTVRNAFEKGVSRQVNEINDYSVQVVFDDNTMQYMDSVKQMVTDRGGTYCESNYSEGLFMMPEGNEGMILISAEPKEIASYIRTEDRLGKAMEIPGEGIIIPRKLAERLKGKNELEILDGKLYRYKAQIAGDYTNYLGVVCLGSKENYEEIFGKEYTVNNLFIKLNENAAGSTVGNADGTTVGSVKAKNEKAAKEAQVDAFVRELSELDEGLRILKPNHLVEKGDNINKLFKVVTLICVGLSIILTFMILINFTNILVKRRMKEMLVMRINGFSLKEVIGYVARESVAITALGIVIGVTFGIGFAYIAVRFMENSHIMYVREPYILAWVFAIVFNAGFTFLIDLISFRNIKKAPLTDVGKY